MTGIERFKTNDPSFFKKSSNKDQFLAGKSILEVLEDPAIFALECTNFVKAKESLVEDTRLAWRLLCVCQIRPLESRVSFSLSNQIAVSVALLSRYAYGYEFSFTVVAVKGTESLSDFQRYRVSHFICIIEFSFQASIA